MPIYALEQSDSALEQSDDSALEQSDSALEQSDSALEQSDDSALDQSDGSALEQSDSALEHSDSSSSESSESDRMNISPVKLSLETASSAGHADSETIINFHENYDRFFDKFIGDIEFIDGEFLVLYKLKSLLSLQYKDVAVKGKHNKHSNNFKLAGELSENFAYRISTIFKERSTEQEDINSHVYDILKLNSLEPDNEYFDFIFYDFLFTKRGTDKEVERYKGDNLTTSKLGLFHSKKAYVSFHQSTIHSTAKNEIEVPTSDNQSFTFSFDTIDDLESLEESIFILSRYKKTSLLDASLAKVSYLDYPFFKRNEHSIIESKQRAKALGFSKLSKYQQHRTTLLKSFPIENFNFKTNGDITDLKLLFERQQNFAMEYIQKTVLSPDKSHLAVLTSFGRIKIFLTSSLKDRNYDCKAKLQFSHLEDNDFFERFKISVETYKQRFKQEVEVHMPNTDWNILNNGSVTDIEWLDDQRLLYSTELYTQRADSDFDTNSVPRSGSIHFGFERGSFGSSDGKLKKNYAIFKEPVLKVLYLPKLTQDYEKRRKSLAPSEGYLYSYSLTLDTFGLLQYPQVIVGCKVDVIERQLLVLVLCENNNFQNMQYVLLNFNYSNPDETNQPISLDPISMVPLTSASRITNFDLVSKEECLIRYDYLFEWVNLKTENVTRRVIVSGKDVDRLETNNDSIILPLREENTEPSDDNLHISVNFDTSESSHMSRSLSLTPEPKEDASPDRVKLLLKPIINKPDSETCFNILPLNKDRVLIYDTFSSVYEVVFDNEKVLAQNKVKIVIDNSKFKNNGKINLLKFSTNKELLMVFNEREVALCSAPSTLDKLQFAHIELKDYT